MLPRLLLLLIPITPQVLSIASSSSVSETHVSRYACTVLIRFGWLSSIHSFVILFNILFPLLSLTRPLLLRTRTYRLPKRVASDSGHHSGASS